MASKPVDLKQAESRLKELVDKAGRGEEIILTEEGKAVAKIVPVRPLFSQRRFGSARGLIHVGPDFDAALEDLRDYE